MYSKQTVDERKLTIDFSAAKFVEENREEISEMLTRLRYTFVMNDGRTFVFHVYFASCAADDIVESCTVVSIPMATLVVEDGEVVMNSIEKETAAYIMGCARKWKMNIV